MKLEDLWSDAEKRHRVTISTFLPNEGEFKMACRADIADMRDRASAGMRRCSDASYTVLREVNRLAAEAVYAPMDSRKLLLTRWAIRATLDAATALERAANSKPMEDKG